MSATIVSQTEDFLTLEALYPSLLKSSLKLVRKELIYAMFRHQLCFFQGSQNSAPP